MTTKSVSTTRTAMCMGLLRLGYTCDHSTEANQTNEQGEADERRVPKQSIEAGSGQERIRNDEDDKGDHQPGGDSRHERTKKIDFTEHRRSPVTVYAPSAGWTGSSRIPLEQDQAQILPPSLSTLAPP